MGQIERRIKAICEREGKMRVETLHSPHGREIVPYICPKCFQEFEALFTFHKHVKDTHGEKKP